MDLELRLMRAAEVGEVADMVKKATSQYGELTVAQYDELFLPGLREGLLDDDAIVVVAEAAGHIVGAYELPHARLVEDELVLERGRLAAGVERQGVGTALLERIQVIFQYIAQDNGTALVHRPIAQKRSTMWANLGYRLTETAKGLRFDPHSYEKKFAPNGTSGTDIRPAEAAIANMLVQRVGVS